MKKILFLLTIMSGVFSVECKDYEDPAQMTEYRGIIAIVNGDIITFQDLDEQMKIASLTSGLKINEENRARVLKSFVVSKLKWSLLKKFISEDDKGMNDYVDATFLDMAKRNNMSSENFSNFLKNKGIDEKTFKHGIRINLSWIEYIKERYKKHTSVTEKELENILADIRTKRNKESFFVSRMFFSREDLAKSETVKIVDQIRHKLAQRASFDSLAQEFSKNSSIGKVENLGWVVDQQISSEEYAALKKMRINETRLVQGREGVSVLVLKDKRAAGKNTITRLRFVQVGMPLPKYANGQDTIGLMDGLKSYYPQAKAFINQARTIGCFVSDPMSAVLEDMNPEIRSAVEHCNAGGLSRVIKNEQALFVFCILDKENQNIPEPTLAEIKAQKIDEKFSTFSEKELSDLKRRACIEKLNPKYGTLSDFISQL